MAGPWGVIQKKKNNNKNHQGNEAAGSRRNFPFPSLMQAGTEESGNEADGIVGSSSALWVAIYRAGGGGTTICDDISRVPGRGGKKKDRLQALMANA